MSKTRSLRRSPGALFRPWSVGAHLGVIVIAVVVVFGTLGTYSALGSLDRAKRQARSDARFQAGLASKGISDSLSEASDQVATLATNPAIAEALADPSDCGLAFSDIAFFPKGHIDLVLANGGVACSSLATKGAPPGATHAGAVWLKALVTQKGAAVSPPFRDRLTGRLVIGVTAPIIDGRARRLGAVIVVAPLDGLAKELRRTYGGPSKYSFAVVSRSGEQVLSEPAASGTTFATRNPISGGGFLSGTQRVPIQGWHVFAGVRPATVLSQTHSLLRREAVLGIAALLVILIALTVVQRRIARPLRRLTDIVSDGPGNQAFVAKRAPAEIMRLTSEFNDMVAARNAHETQLSHQALHDPLTGLANRALLSDRLSQAVAHARPDSLVAVLSLGLDHFKLINDGLGHTAGDQVLITIASRLTDEMALGTTVAHFSGDQFLLVCEGLSDADEAAAIADRLAGVIGARFEVANRVVILTASIGITVCSGGRGAEDLIREADTAMYAAKATGRDGHEIFTAEQGTRVTDRLLIENELRVALGRGEMWLAYQPKVDLVTGEMAGVEALLRWDHPALGSVSPMTFIPVAEDIGMIVPIGEFVLEEAVRQAAAWRAQGHDLVVSVNVSGRQMDDKTLPDLVLRTLLENDLPAGQLCLELTESVLMSDPGDTIAALNRLHSLGVRVSIDDFGTGYSSLAYLQQFPVDELKIDRSFVKDMTTVPSQATLVAAMVAMGKALDLSVVAEGVETAAQAAELHLLGCHLAQGYLYAKPQAAAELRLLLTRKTLTSDRTCSAPLT